MKKTYFQPEVQVAQIEASSIICTSGAASTSGAGKVNTGVETNEPW